MQKIYKIYPILLVITMFCPYLVKSLGIRFEHLIVYPMLGLTIFLLATGQFKINRYLMPLIVMWTGFLVISVVRTVFSNEYSSISLVFADLDNFLQPLAMMMFYLLLPKQENKDLLQRVTGLFTLLLSINTLFIFASMATDLSSVNDYFWRGSVAVNSLSNGRYVGIFNQPLESGLSYSIGVLGWIYNIEKRGSVKIRDLLVIVILLVGGLMSVSKVFILGGIPLFLFGAFTNQVIRKRVFPIIAFLVPLLYLSFFFLRTSWEGFGYLLRFLKNDSGNLMQNLTAGRFGGENTMKGLFGDVWNQFPVYGLGLGKTPIIDSEWFEFFGTGGVIGISLLVIFMLTLIFMAIQFKFAANLKSESKLFGLLVVLCLLGSIGAPVFTLNRASTILWILIGLLSHVYWKEKAGWIKEKPYLLLAKPS